MVEGYFNITVAAAKSPLTNKLGGYPHFHMAKTKLVSELLRNRFVFITFTWPKVLF